MKAKERKDRKSERGSYPERFIQKIPRGHEIPVIDTDNVFSICCYRLKFGCQNNGTRNVETWFCIMACCSLASHFEVNQKTSHFDAHLSPQSLKFPELFMAQGQTPAQ